MPRKPLDLTVRRARIVDEAAAEALERRAEALGTTGVEHAPPPAEPSPTNQLEKDGSANEAGLGVQARADLPARYERDRNVLKRRKGAEVRRMCIYLPLSTHEQLTRLCFENGRTQTEVIDEALSEYLARQRE